MGIHLYTPTHVYPRFQRGLGRVQVFGHKMRPTFLPLLMLLSTTIELCRGDWVASGATSDAALRRDGGLFNEGGGKDTRSHALVCLCQGPGETNIQHCPHTGIYPCCVIGHCPRYLVACGHGPEHCNSFHASAFALLTV